MKNNRLLYSYYALTALAILGTAFLLFKQNVTRVKSRDNRMGSIVRLVRDGNTICTGVVVSNSTVITASHCILQETPFGFIVDPRLVEIRDYSNRPTGVYGTPYGSRIQLDQAVLMGDFSQFQHRPTITSVHELNKIGKVDQTLIACGYPMGGPLVCNKMVFKELYDFMWATNGLLIPGMSGGPVMLEDGTVVALNIAVHQNFSLVSPIYNLDMLYKGQK